MSGVNKAIIIGNLGQDPEIRYTQDGKAIANISIATSEQWKDKQTGEKQERTEWHKVTAFGKLGEIIGEYLRKGSKVYIEGRIQTDKWQDKEGNDRYTTKIIAGQMQMLDSRGGGTANFDNNYDSGQSSSGGGGGQPEPVPMGDFDDDIPF